MERVEEWKRGRMEEGKDGRGEEWSIGIVEGSELWSIVAKSREKATFDFGNCR
jgi:hypothetical protein